MGEKFEINDSLSLSWRYSNANLIDCEVVSSACPPFWSHKVELTSQVTSLCFRLTSSGAFRKLKIFPKD